MAGIPAMDKLTRARVHMVGIKGTGMAALAEILSASGARLTGSDTDERFYTDTILESINVVPTEGFSASNIPEDAEIVIYSLAYDPDSHVELVEAHRRGLPVISYPQALGQVSATMPSVGIAGVHGKTSTAALCAAIVDEAGLPGTVLAGSSLANSNGHATLIRGDRFFIAETCEYRRAFLNFVPSVVVVTSIEPDHVDYFADEKDIQEAFTEYALRLPEEGTLIFCADDPGASLLADQIRTQRPGVNLKPYGVTAAGAGRVEYLPSPAGETHFTVGRQPFTLNVPGRHNALNAAAALLAVDRARGLRPAAGDAPGDAAGSPEITDARFAAIARQAILEFRGTKRRSEVVGEARGVLVIDDYGHHPTAIRATLEGLREFYPGRRLILDFMSHTYSRTRAFLSEFASAIAASDLAILHEIYASAREQNPGDVSGKDLAAQTQKRMPAGAVHYVPDVMDALPLCKRIVRPGDLFVTMGAGNNWQLGIALIDFLKSMEATS